MLPNFIGLGANRSGSTWIANNLMQHPDVYMPLKKEIHFFDRHYQKGKAYYEQEFSGWSGEPAVGEITPAYFHDQNVAPLIKNHLPDVKLFVSLRNPIDRAYSQYWHMIARGEVENTASFEDVLASRDWVLDIGCYHRHLSRYYDYFAKDALKVQIFDDIKLAPQEFMCELLQFLNLETTLNPDLINQQINASASLQRLARNRLLSTTYRLLKRIRLFKLSGKVEQINRTTLPPMQPETRSRLLSYYRDDILQTQDLIQKDLSSWLTEPDQ